MTTRHGLRLFDTIDDLSRAAAELVARLAQEAVQRHGRFTVALAGGSTPKRLYRLLAEETRWRDAIPWSDVHVFWGDERHVPPTHADSNFRMADEALLSRVPIPPSHINRIVTEDPHADAAATAYERTLRDVFALTESQCVSFDLMLLGMGADGHTASLFPGSSALDERTRLVVAPWVERFGAYRITLTPPVLASARATAVLVSGLEKAVVLHEVLEGPFRPECFPIQCLRASTGAVTWFIDALAASAIGGETRSR